MECISTTYFSLLLTLWIQIDPNEYKSIRFDTNRSAHESKPIVLAIFLTTRICNNFRQFDSTCVSCPNQYCSIIDSNDTIQIDPNRCNTMVAGGTLAPGGRVGRCKASNCKRHLACSLSILILRLRWQCNDEDATATATATTTSMQK